VDEADLKRYLQRGREVLANGFVAWDKRSAFGSVALASSVIFSSMAEAARPPENINPAEWAQKYRYVSADSGSPWPGKWDNANSPYAIKPLEALGPDHPAKGVVLPWSAQVAKTEVGVCWFGYVADIEGLPMLITQAGLVEVDKFNRYKLQPTIDVTPRLKAVIEDESDKSGKGSTTKIKAYRGGGCILASALSSSALQAITRARYWGDEVGEYPAEAGSRGDPVKQALKRLEAYGAISKYLLTSTCQYKHSCRITQEFNRSTKHRLYVPCPDCGDYQILEFDSLGWSTTASGLRVPVFSCAACGVDIHEVSKREMVSAGIWVPTFEAKRPDGDARAPNPVPGLTIPADEILDWEARDVEGHTIYGYHLWKAYSLGGEWASILTEFEDAEGDPEAMKVFWQQTLAEPWDEAGEAPDHEELARMVEDYEEGVVPHGAYFTTGAMDVQKDRIEWATYGWGPRMQGWLIEKGIIEGDTDQPEVWNAARELWSTKSYKYGSGLVMPVDLWGVDSGYRSPYVYQATKGFPNVYNLDGRGADKPHAPPLSSPKTITHKVGKMRIGATRKYDVGTYNLKSRMYGMIRQWKEGPSDEGEWPRGVIHFNKIADVEFFEQVTAEVLIPHQRRGGRISYYWQKIKQRPNEHHDILIYNMALACHMRWDSRRPEDWADYIAERGGEPELEQKSFEALWSAPPKALPDGVTESKVLPRGGGRAASLALLAALNKDDDEDDY